MLISYWNRHMETNNSELEIRHPNVAYERRDMDYRTVFVFLFVLLCAGLAIHIGLWGAFEQWGMPQYAGHQTTNPIMTSNEELKEIGGDPALTFPAPRLQPNPVADLNKFRVREEQQLNSYGWVDACAGRARIPIDRAIDILGTSWDQQQTLVGGQAASAQPAIAPHAGGTNQPVPKP
jgi:hypothetical protein